MDTTTTGLPLGSKCEYCDVAQGAEHVDGCPLKPGGEPAEAEQQPEEKRTAIVQNAPTENAGDEPERPEGVQDAFETRHIAIDDDHLVTARLWRAVDDGSPQQFTYALTVFGIPGLEVWGEDEDSTIAQAKDEILAHIAMRKEAGGELPPAVESVETEPHTEGAPEGEDWYQVGKIVDVDGQPARVVYDEHESAWRQEPLIQVPLEELARDLSRKLTEIKSQKAYVKKHKDKLQTLQDERDKIDAEIASRGEQHAARQLGLGEYDQR